MKTIAFGEILWDVYPDEKHIGGAPLNFAAHLARHGEQVALLSAVGRDELGDLALRQLKKWGISDEYVSVLSEKQTGRCMVTLDDSGVPSYNLLDDVAYDRIACPEVTKADVLYFGTLALRSKNNFQTLKRLLKHNAFTSVFVDINLRKPFYSPEIVEFAVQNATILKVSMEELEQTAALLGITQNNPGEFAKQLADEYKNLSVILITLGADGAYSYSADSGKEYTCPGIKVPVCSTVGAGDSFSAAFIHEYLLGNDMDSCLMHAVYIAGLVVSRPEAVPDYAPYSNN